MNSRSTYYGLALAVAAALGTTAALAATAGNDQTPVASVDEATMLARSGGPGEGRMRESMEEGADKARGAASHMRERVRNADDDDAQYRDRDRDRDRDEEHEPDRDRDRDRDEEHEPDRDRDRDGQSFDED